MVFCLYFGYRIEKSLLFGSQLLRTGHLKVIFFLMLSYVALQNKQYVAVYVNMTEPPEPPPSA